ncbi:DUF6364 family protein [Glycocaulis abyssi]|uniref:DUF6364 family protein n=1 Tax=Glycocaulis abyssi TaxID=1433403 RepID=A0ABV9NE42_9PROT
MTKNLTLAIEDELLDRARIIAAIRRTSVNAMVREYLEREVRREGDDARRADAWAAFFRETGTPRSGPEAGEGVKFDREELYNEVLRERGLL